jgi:glycosyltransferase involved in cell wall biosynthesis
MDIKKKVAIIGTNGIPARYGGFETLAENLVAQLGDKYEFTVYCSNIYKKHERKKTYKNAKLKYLPLKANGWQSFFYDFLTIFHAYFHSQSLIILGFSGAFAFPLNKIFRKNIIFNIGGIEWQKIRGTKSSSKIEIRLKKWMEKLCVRNSTTIIIDNLSFEKYLENKYRINPILAEYGGDHAVSYPITEDIIKKYPFIKTEYDLTVSRAQEDMNIHLVIEAYKSIPQRKIVIISNWQISDYGKNLYLENKDKYNNIILLPSIYEPNELNAIRANCQIYLHTHSLCGTAPSLVEAMFLNLPIVAFDVPSNRATTENKAIYFSDVSDLISTMTNLDIKKLDQLKCDMYEIATRRYTWDRIVNIYQNCINH